MEYKQKKRYCTVYIVRHGETELNVKRVIQGQTDSPLTKLGEKQARERGNNLSHINFDAVYSSDLLRAKRTAEIILLEKKLAVSTTKALRERAFGRFEGKTFEEYGHLLQKELEELRLLDEKSQFSHKLHPDIESDEEIVGRFITFLREVSIANTGKTVLVVSHGGIMRAFLIHLGWGTARDIDFGSIHNLAYAKVECDGVEFAVKETEGIEKVKLK